MRAIAVFKGKLKGYVSFTQLNPSHSVRVVGSILNLKKGKHELYVHQFGNLTRSDCMTCGGHFNGINSLGDFDNITITEDNHSIFHFKTHKVSLFSGQMCIIGRSLVVHEREDGNDESVVNRKRLDCAVIGYDQEWLDEEPI